jgi:hypothetical protein
MRFTPVSGELAVNHHLRLNVIPEAERVSLQPVEEAEVHDATSAVTVAGFIDLSSSSRPCATLIAAARDWLSALVRVSVTVPMASPNTAKEKIVIDTRISIRVKPWLL